MRCPLIRWISQHPLETLIATTCALVWAYIKLS